MAQIADITIKKHDGTTDIVWTALSPSSGDNSPSIWRQDAESIPAFRPIASVRTVYNTPKTARKLFGQTRVPYAVDGALVATVPFNWDLTLPLMVPSTATNEAVSQTINLIAHSLFREMMLTGYSAR
jgi:hypothetical protein